MKTWARSVEQGKPIAEVRTCRLLGVRNAPAENQTRIHEAALMNKRARFISTAKRTGMSAFPDSCHRLV
ncbi:MAG: hypothetical protein QOH70_2301 [Blastocatellia bacterium]|jgi:hypothetical protein|nr:hypothetical protein [Blastocatellia bacterium]